jgi:hypothetical protein
MGLLMPVVYMNMCVLMPVVHMNMDVSLQHRRIELKF